MMCPGCVSGNTVSAKSRFGDCAGRIGLHIYRSCGTDGGIAASGWLTGSCAGPPKKKDVWWSRTMLTAPHRGDNHHVRACTCQYVARWVNVRPASGCAFSKHDFLGLVVGTTPTVCPLLVQEPSAILGLPTFIFG